MANRFVDGSSIKFKWDPAGTGAEIELGIKSHSVDLECLRHDVSNTKHGGRTARIGGKGDARGNVTASLDLDEMPHNTPFSIFPGLKGVAKFGLTATDFVQIGVVVVKLHYEASVDSEVRWNFDIEEDYIAGVLLMPATPA